jgi:DNA-binding NarL/FixJ family response regulator
MIQGKGAFIVAKPGPLREALRAALGAMPCVHVVGEVDEPVSALRAHLDPAPALIVLSAENSGLGTLDAWQQIRAHWPEARCIILADTVQQREKARAAGADLVLLKGFAAGRLFAAVEALFGETEAGHSAGDASEGEE